MTSAEPTAADNVKLVFDAIAKTVPVSSSPVSSVNAMTSPTFNSVVNLVFLPITAALEFAILNVPVSIVCESSKGSTESLVKTVSAVNAAEAK